MSDKINKNVIIKEVKPLQDELEAIHEEYSDEDEELIRFEDVNWD